jgi:hypothetical protein
MEQNNFTGVKIQLSMTKLQRTAAFIDGEIVPMPQPKLSALDWRQLAHPLGIRYAFCLTANSIFPLLPPKPSWKGK